MVDLKSFAHTVSLWTVVSLLFLLRLFSRLLSSFSKSYYSPRWYTVMQNEWSSSLWEQLHLFWSDLFSIVWSTSMARRLRCNPVSFTGFYPVQLVKLRILAHSTQQAASPHWQSHIKMCTLGLISRKVTHLCSIFWSALNYPQIWRHEALKHRYLSFLPNWLHVWPWIEAVQLAPSHDRHGYCSGNTY